MVLVRQILEAASAKSVTAHDAGMEISNDIGGTEKILSKKSKTPFSSFLMMALNFSETNFSVILQIRVFDGDMF